MPTKIPANNPLFNASPKFELPKNLAMDSPTDENKSTIFEPTVPIAVHIELRNPINPEEPTFSVIDVPKSFNVLITFTKKSVIVFMPFPNISISFIPSRKLLSHSPKVPVMPSNPPLSPVIAPTNFIAPPTTDFTIVAKISIMANNPLNVDFNCSDFLSDNISFFVNSSKLFVIL